ncbi:MAG: tryptophan synthase subunit alpha [Spirochaetia bacterium]|jgi:tryptophan synthase alpha chain
MSTRDAFSADAANGLLTLAGYLPAGYPRAEEYDAAVGELSDAGFRILEIGIPPAPSGMDGRIIEEAVALVARAGMEIRSALALGGRAASRRGMAAIGMLYHATVEEVGLAACMELFLEHGIHAILVPDMPGTEWKQYAQEAGSRGIEAVGFIPPDADEPAIRCIAAQAQGFLYVPSYAGRTGSSFDKSGSLSARLSRIRAASAESGLPLAVGFGLRSARDVEAVRMMGAQGAIVGTALVEAAGKGQATLRDLTRRIASARGGMPCRR